MRICLRITAIAALVVLSGCKCDDCAVGATRFDNGVERVEWSREGRRGTSKSSFDVSVDMPKNAEYREIVLELIGKAWRHGVGPSTRRVILENLEDAYEDFRTIVAEVYPEDFDLSEYGAGGDIYGRVEALDEDCMRYRLRVAYQPVGNPAYGCELEVEARRCGDDGRVKRSLLIKEVALSDWDTWR